MTDRARIARLVAEAFARTNDEREYTYLACPVCQGPDAPTNRPKLWVRRSDGAFACWRCGVRGFLPGRARSQTADPFDAPTGHQAPSQAAEDAGRCIPIGGRSMALTGPQLALTRRGVPRSVWDDVHLMLAVDGPHKGRVVRHVDPVHSGLGWTGWDWTGRRLPKYLTAKGTDRQRYVLGEDVLRRAREFVVVVEGFFDFLRLWPHAVACLGKPTKGQIERLGMLDVPVVVMLDGDAWREGYAVAEQLRVLGATAYAILLPPTEDPDSIGRAAAMRAVGEALRQRCDIDMRNLERVAQ